MLVKQIIYIQIKVLLKMNKKLGFELKRKFVHVFSILYMLIYWLALKYYNKQIALLSLVAILIFFLIIEFFRLKKKKKIPIIHIFWRKSEKNKLAGYIYFITGAIAAFALFDFDIALAALLMTTFGDMAAAIFGISFGKHWLKSVPDTAWEGVIAEFLVDILIGSLILSNWTIIVAMALIATIVETFLVQVDDNLSIPLSAGLVAQFLRILA